MSVHVYLIQQQRPWKAAECFPADLKTTKSGASWAFVGSLGRRFKIGATAFLTPEAADRRRLGKCAANLTQQKVWLYSNIGHPEIVDASARAQPPRVYRRQIATT